MATGPITSWQIDEEKMQTVTDFIFFVSKITSIMVIEAMKFKDAYSLEENDVIRVEAKSEKAGLKLNI